MRRTIHLPRQRLADRGPIFRPRIRGRGLSDLLRGRQGLCMGRPCGGCGPAPTCTTTICVVACGVAIPGATVSIAGGSTGTTGATGCVSLTIPASGTFSVTVTIPGFPANTSTQTLSCVGTTTINLGSPPTGGVCCGATTSSPCNCAPYPETIFITDDCGTTALTNGGTIASWVGCTSCGAAGAATNINVDGTQVCTEGGGQVSISYTVGCSPSSSGNCESGTSATTWSVVRTWFVCSPPDQNCPPLNCQNAFSTDGTCTPINSGDTEPCGSSFNESGNFTATSCTPLAVSGDLIGAVTNFCFDSDGNQITVSSPLGPSFSLSS
jgi:hypothetical protein